MHPRYLQSCRNLFLLLFLTHKVCVCHLSGVRPCTSSTLLSFGQFVWVFLMSILRIIQSFWLRVQPRCWWVVLGFEKFSCLSEVLFSYFFPFISAFWMESSSNISKYLSFSFSLNVLILSCYGSSIPSAICLLPLFIMSMPYFSMSKSIPVSRLNILIVYIRFYSTFGFFCEHFDVFYVLWW